MTTNQNALSSKISNGKTGKSGWFTGGVLVIAAAVAISFAIRSAPAKIQPALDRAAEPARHAQTVPDANTQSVLAYLAAHGAGSSAAAQVVPDANTQGVAGYLAAHGAGSSAAAQVAPDANTRSVMAYLKAHGVGQPSRTQAVPDAATKSVFAYLRAHGVNVP